MEINLFTELVKKHFDFLLKQYGFSIVHEDYYPDIMGNSWIVFTSHGTGISIVLDKGQVLMNVGPSSLSREKWYEFSDIISFFAPDQKPVYVFPDGFSEYKDALENQVSRLARLMEEYCRPILQGDFSMQNQIKEIENKRVSKMLEHFNKLSKNSRFGRSPQKPSSNKER